MTQVLLAGRLREVLVISLIMSALSSYAANCRAEIVLQGMLGDLMVLQRNAPIPIFGRALPHESVRVSFADQAHVATAGADGQWRVTLQPMPATTDGSKHDLRVTGSLGSNPLLINNVVVGDVWLCAGASNMAFPVMKSPTSAATMELALYPDIRFFSVWGGPEESPRTDCGGVWTQCNPGTVEAFSAVGYSFGRQLHETLRIPIGLIRNPWDATRVNAWAPPRALKDQHATQSAASNNPQAIGQNLLPPTEAEPRHRPSALYNGLVAPLTDFPIRGVIWFQGEADLHAAESYESHLQSVISGWRSAWRQTTLPFGVVQIAASFGQTSDARPNAKSLKAIQSAQEVIHQSNPGVGLVAIDDLIDAGGITRHDEVGRRLADWALKDVYQLGPDPVADVKRNSSAASHGSGSQLGKELKP